MEQDFAKFLKRFKEDIFETFEEELTKIVQPNMEDAVQKVIYDKYTPQSYKRRKKDRGGLQHSDNTEPTFDKDKNTITALIRNKSQGERDLQGKYLDAYLHDGTMFPPSHPAYKKLKRQLYDDPKHGMIRRIQRNEKALAREIKSGMNAKGWR